MNVKLEYASFQDFANRLWPCLSEEGMWVPSERTAGVGELVDFDVMLADGFRLFHGTGQVIGVGPGPAGAPAGSGMTIRFSQLDGSSRNLIQKVVSKHRGEGGRPFVLSAPATKVEVVGEDRSGHESRSMGPEDLVAPFPDLEAEADWADGGEPELTSFLRPSGGSTELDLEPDSGDLPSLELIADPPAAAEPPTANDAITPEPEPPAPEAEMASESEEVPVEDTPVEEVPPTPAPEPEPLALDEDGAELSESLPAEEPPRVPAEDRAQATFSQLQDEFEGEVGKTQAVEPGVLEQDAPEASQRGGSALPFSLPDVEPMPSTAVPPPVEPYDSGDFDDDELLAQAPAGARLAKWLWALVGVVALVAGFFLVQRFLGRDTGGEPVAAAQPPADAEIAVVAGVGDATSDPDPLSATEDGPGSSADDGAGAGSEVTDGLGDEGSAAGASADDGSVDAPMVGDENAGADAPAADSETVATAATPAGTEPVAQEPAPPAAAEDLLRLQRITSSERDGDTVIRLWLDGAAPLDRLSTLRVSEGAPRLVVKIAGIAGAVPRTPTTIDSAHVQRLRFGVHPGPGGAELHVVADLADAAVDMIGSLVVDDSGVEIRFGRAAD